MDYQRALMVAGLVIAVYIFWVMVRTAVFVGRSRPAVEENQPFQHSPEDPSSSLLVVGDSTAAGVGSELGGVPYYFSKEFEGLEVVTRAESGRKLEDIDSSMFDGDFDAVLVMVGGNDILRLSSTEKVREELARVLDGAKEASEEVIVLHSGNVGQSPFFVFPFDSFYSWRTRRVRKVYIDVCREMNATYIDLYTSRGEDPFAEEPERYYAPDRLHLSDRGYSVWFNEILEQSDVGDVLRAKD